MKNYFPRILWLSAFSFFSASGQVHPVQMTTQLIPPYSVYLADYAAPGNNKLRVLATQNDFTKASYRIRLKFSLQLDGREVLRTSGFFNL